MTYIKGGVLLKSRLYLVKLGGSLITDKTKPYTPRMTVIRRLAREIKEAVSRGVKMIIGHGGGSFPHVSATKYEVHKGFIRNDSAYGMAVVHNDAMKLNGIIMDELLKVGIKAYSIQPSSIIITENSEIKEIYVKPIKVLLKYGITPVVYGDVGIDIKRGCCIVSTEQIFKQLALKLQGEYDLFIIMCEEVDGIYSKDPLKYPDAKFIEEVSRRNIDEVRSYLNTSRGIDVTGGMLHKVNILYELAMKGINSIIINGLKKNNLKNTLLGRNIKGTVIKY